MNTDSFEGQQKVARLESAHEHFDSAIALLLEVWDEDRQLSARSCTAVRLLLDRGTDALGSYMDGFAGGVDFVYLHCAVSDLMSLGENRDGLTQNVCRIAADALSKAAKQIRIAAKRSNETATEEACHA